MRLSRNFLVVAIVLGMSAAANAEMIGLGASAVFPSYRADNFDMMNISLTDATSGSTGVELAAGVYSVDDFAFNAVNVGNGAGLVPFLGTATGEVLWVGPEVTGITTSGINSVAYTGEEFSLASTQTIYAGFTQEDFGYSLPDAASMPAGFLPGIQVAWDFNQGLILHFNMYDPNAALPNDIHAAPSVGDMINVAAAPLARGFAFEVNVSAVPEPGTLALLATGLLGLAACIWRKRK